MTIPNFIKKFNRNTCNSWITSISILSFGLISFAYLNGISNLSLHYIKRKNRLDQLKKTDIVIDKIKNEDRIIFYYWNYYNFIFITSIFSIYYIARNSIKSNNNI